MKADRGSVVQFAGPNSARLGLLPIIRAGSAGCTPPSLPNRRTGAQPGVGPARDAQSANRRVLLHQAVGRRWLSQARPRRIRTNCPGSPRASSADSDWTAPGPTRLKPSIEGPNSTMQVRELCGARGESGESRAIAERRPGRSALYHYARAEAIWARSAAAETPQRKDRTQHDRRCREARLWL